MKMPIGGAGIAGLSVTCLLHCDGHRVTLFARRQGGIRTLAPSQAGVGCRLRSAAGVAVSLPGYTLGARDPAPLRALALVLHCGARHVEDRSQRGPRAGRARGLSIG